MQVYTHKRYVVLVWLKNYKAVQPIYSENSWLILSERYGFLSALVCPHEYAVGLKSRR